MTLIIDIITVADLSHFGPGIVPGPFTSLHSETVQMSHYLNDPCVSGHAKAEHKAEHAQAYTDMVSLCKRQKADLATDVLVVLRKMRDMHPHVWDDMIASEIGPDICTLWDRLRALLD